MGNREVDAPRVLGADFLDEEAVRDDEARPVAVAGEFVRRLLAHDEERVGVRDTAEPDRLVGNDDLGLGGAAPGLRPVRLGLDGELPVEQRGLGKDDAGGDQALPAGAGKAEILLHADAASFPDCARSMISS